VPPLTTSTVGGTGSTAAGAHRGRGRGARRFHRQMAVLPEKMYRLAQRVVVHERHARHAVAVRRELRERELTHAERDQGRPRCWRCARAAPGGPPPAALELRGAGGLDPPHRSATACRRQPRHHACDEPTPPTGTSTVRTAGSCSAISSPTVAALPRCPDGRTGAQSRARPARRSPRPRAAGRPRYALRAPLPRPTSSRPLLSPPAPSRASRPPRGRPRAARRTRAPWPWLPLE